MYKMCHYEAAMDKIGEDIPWIEDEQNLPVRTYGGLTRNHIVSPLKKVSVVSQLKYQTVASSRELYIYISPCFKFPIPN